MTSSTRQFRRVVIAVLLAAFLPQLFGFLSGFSYFVTGEEVTPSWVHVARMVAVWIAVIAVFAWFIARHEGPVVGHFVLVVVLTWVCSETLAAGTVAILSRSIEPAGPVWEFSFLAVGVTLLRALLGLAVGVTIRHRRAVQR